jgi:hypothetical protein
MIFYNVTCSMDAGISDEWLKWMLETHIPEVMATGCFLGFKVLRLQTNAPDDEGVNYAVQYTANSNMEYENYRDNYAPGLQQKTRDKYGDTVIAFRTILEVITEG